MGALFGPDSPFIAAICSGRDLVEKWQATGPLSLTREDRFWDPDLLASIAEAAFWASIAVEEGRSVQGKLCLVSPGDNPAALTLQKSLEVTPDSLIGMLTAASGASVGVDVPSTGEPQIWGLVQLLPEGALCIDIMGPGTLVASINGYSLALFCNGHGGELNSLQGQPLLLAIARALGQDQTTGTGMPQAAKLLQIVRAMHDHGHGGTLIVVPTGYELDRSEIDFKHEFDDRGSQALKVELLEIGRIGNVSPRPPDETEVTESGPPASSLWAGTVRREAENEALERIAGLTAIDGALVISEDFSLLGFGAKLSSRCEEDSFSQVDAVSGSQVHGLSLSDAGGTRHQSAAHFVAKNKRSIAFVASQDGMLTWFRSGDNGLLAVTNLQYWISEY